jgi:hypothetical protein
MSRNMYEERAVKCVRLAEQTNDAIISFGLFKMAQAWLDLAEKNSRPELVRDSTPGSSSEHTKSRRLNKRTRSSSRRLISRSKDSRISRSKGSRKSKSRIRS